MVGQSEGLASALEKLGAYSGRLPLDAKPATAHMFIVNPLSGKSLMNLFSTHPPLEDRIARLPGNEPTDRPRRKCFERGHTEAKNLWDRFSQ